MVVQCPRPPLILLLPPLVSDNVPPITLAATRTRVSQAPFTQAIETPTSIRLLPRVRRQRFREKHRLLHTMLVNQTLVVFCADLYRMIPRLPVVRPARRPVHMLRPLRRLLIFFRAQFRRREGALRAQFPLTTILFRRWEPALQAPLPSAMAKELTRQVPLPSATRCPHSTKAVAPARRSFQWVRAHSLPSVHATAVVLKCVKTDTGTPEMFVRARLGPSSQQKWALYPCSYQRGVDKISYLVHILQRATQKQPSPVGLCFTTHPGPIFEVVCWVCRPSFVSEHATRRVCSVPSAPGEQEKFDTARRASGHSTVSGQVKCTACP